MCALLHDIGDTLGTFNHADIAATILKPFVSEANHWMVEKHAIFQGYNFFHFIGMDRNLRDNFKDHAHYKRCEEFVALYDNPAFDAKAETLPISEFEPMLRRVFAQPKQSLYKAALDAKAAAEPRHFTSTRRHRMNIPSLKGKVSAEEWQTTLPTWRRPIAWLPPMAGAIWSSPTSARAYRARSTTS